MKKEEIIRDITTLKNISGVRFNKYLRNARLYTWTPGLSLRNINQSQVIGYYDLNTYGEDNTSSIQENVIASCVDTLVSKIASTKVRPFFNTVKGSFRDIQVAKQTQHFFDIFFDKININKIITSAFKDACIFDTGIVYIDEDYNIKRALPWLVYTDPAEATYNNITRVVYEIKNDPTREDSGSTYYYWNSGKKTYAVYDGSKCTMKEYKHDKVPFIFLHYNDPIVSNSSTSIADLLYGIQMEIDLLLQKIEDASKLNPALTFFVPEGSTLKANQIDNRIGNIITYKASNLVQNPITTATPAFIDPQYMQLLTQLKQDAYEAVGISQLSATSQKPVGLDSGKALSTMENIESDRFETQLNAIIRSYTDLAKLYIELTPDDWQVLPTSLMREEIDWKEVKETIDNMNIQFSGADALSKDPQTKLQQLQMLASAGLLPQSRIAMLMEIPDLEQGYSLSNNALNAVLAVIDDCITKDIYDVPFFIPQDMLKTEIANTMLSLKAADSQGNKDDIAKLQRLYEAVVQGQQYVNGIEQAKAQEEQMEGANEQLQQANIQQAQQINATMANNMPNTMANSTQEQAQQMASAFQN